MLGHQEDPDGRQAAFRADLDCMIHSARGEHECHGDTVDNDALVRLWTHGQVRRYGAWLPLCRSTGIDTLLRFGVAPVLLLRVQLGAAWMFLLMGLLSVAATVENIYAWREVEELGGADPDASANASTGEALDDLTTLVHLGLTNGSVVLQMTTLGWQLSSVSATTARLQNWLVAAQLVLVLLFLVWVRRKMRVKSYTADRRHVTASDFTIMVSGLKRDPSPEFLRGQLQHWFAQEFGGGAHQEDHQVRVVMAVDCNDTIQLLTRRKARWLDVKDAEATLRQQGPSPERTANLSWSQAALAEVDIELRRAAARARCGSGTAFVTFEYASERNACLARFAVPEWVRALELLGLRRMLEGSVWSKQYARRRQLTQNFGDVDADELPLAKVVEVSAAPEPEDVLWENLEVSRVRSIAYTAASLLVVVLLLCVSTLIMLLLKWAINDVYVEIDNCRLRYEEAELGSGASKECAYDQLLSWGTNTVGTNKALTMLTMLLSCASAVTLIILNTLIRTTVYAMAQHECKHTRTLKEKTVFYKMSFAYTTNSALLLMLVYYDEAADWGKPGLVLNQALLLLCSDLALNSIVSRLTNGMGYWPLYRWYGRRVAVSQARLQEYYRPPTLLLGEMYASVVRTYALCMYYGPMQPLCYWLGACTMLANYLCSKYALLHYCRVPPRMSDELCEGLRQVLSVLLVGHIVLTFYFYTNSCQGGCRSQVWTPLVLGAVAYVLFVLVPVKYVPCLARFHVQAEEARCLGECCREAAEADMEAEVGTAAGMPSEAAEGAGGGVGVPDLRYSALLARLQAWSHGSHVEASGQVDAAAHVTYDVPVPELGGAHGVTMTNQPRFLRYDFTPEILRAPYCFPLPAAARGGQAAGEGYALNVQVTSAHLAIAAAQVPGQVGAERGLEQHDSI